MLLALYPGSILCACQGHRAVEMPSQPQTPASAAPGRAPTAITSALRTGDFAHDPILLPRLTSVETTVPQGATPESIALVKEGLRFALGADASFAVGRGVLPLSRQLETLELPPRLGSGWLFMLRAADDSWLLRAPTFTGDLQPIGKIEVPTRSVVPGFEGLYATIAGNGSVLAIEPRTGRAEESSLLPASAEYGPIAIVDDEFGATIDPLRGLLVSLDAGRHWQPLADTFGLGADALFDAAGAAHAVRVPAYRAVRAIRAAAGELEVEFFDQRRLWFSRRGKAVEPDEPVRRESPAQRLAQWVEQQRAGPLKGWPIELAVTAGTLMRPDHAAFVAGGLLVDVRLRDGRVVDTRSAGVAKTATCQAYRAEAESYFLCRTSAATSILWLTTTGRLEQLAVLDGQREVAAVTNHGLTLRDRCAWHARATQPGGACVIRPGQTPVSVEPWSTRGGEQIVAIDATTVGILQPPSTTASGEIRYIGHDSTRLRIVVPEAVSSRQRTMLARGRWLDQPHVVHGDWFNWIVLDDELMGAHVAADGKLTLGEVVPRAMYTCVFQKHAIVADASGYAKETWDGGLTFVRPRLPTFVTDSGDSSRVESRQWSGSSVGCTMGNWLRVGWSSPTTSSDAPTLVPVSEPEPIRITGPQRRIPRIHCELAPDLSPNRVVVRPAQTKSATADESGVGGSVRRLRPPEATAELRAHSPSARMTLVHYRDGTRSGYLVTSSRLRLVDRKWLIYPIQAQTGVLDEPLVIPMDRGIRPCVANEDRWRVDVYYDLIANVEADGALGHIGGRVLGRLRLSADGACAEPIPVGAKAYHSNGTVAARRRPRGELFGIAVDSRGNAHAVACQILEPGVL